MTGEQLFTDKGREFIKKHGISSDDYCGHGTIRLWWGIDSGDGTNKECTDCSSPDNFPSEIVHAIKQGKMRGFTVPQSAIKQLLSKPAWAKYNEVEQQALAKYNEVKQPAWAKYNEVEQPAWAKYNEVKQQALAKYNEVKQPAFWDLFLANEENRSPKWR